MKNASWSVLAALTYLSKHGRLPEGYALPPPASVRPAGISGRYSVVNR